MSEKKPMKIKYDRRAIIICLVIINLLQIACFISNQLPMMPVWLSQVFLVMGFVLLPFVIWADVSLSILFFQKSAIGLGGGKAIIGKALGGYQFNLADIQKVDMVFLAGFDHVCILLKEERQWVKGLSKMQKMNVYFTKLFFGSHISIPTYLVKVKPSDLIETLGSDSEKAGLNNL